MELFKDYTTVLVSYLYEDKFDFQCNYPHWKSDRFLVEYIEKRLKRKQKSKNRKINTRNIKRFIRYLDEKYPYSIDFDTKKEIFEKLKYIMECQPIAISLFQKYLDIVKPKLVIVNRASYLSFLGIAMMIACKRKNILTAEIQHGMIGKWSESYHCGNAIRKNGLCKLVYPDYLLTRGSYWNQMIDIPTELYVIGNSKLADVKIAVENNHILFIAETDMNFYKSILDYIMDRIEKNVILYFRLHPYRYNKETLEDFRKYNKYDNFVLANDKELNFYLNRCKFVVSSYSTVTYEALSVGRIVLFLKEKGFDKIYEDVKDMVYEFSDGKEFMDIWNKKEKLKSIVYRNLFDNEWEKGYSSFLKKIGISIKKLMERGRSEL